MRIGGLVRDLKKGKVLAGYWLVGHPFLVETCVDLLTSGVGADENNRTNISLPSDDLVDMWTALNEYGSGARRLVVVRGADVLWEGSEEEVAERIDRLGSWLADPNVKNVTAVFVDRAPRWGKEDLSRPERARKLFVGQFTARATWIDSSENLTPTKISRAELVSVIALVGRTDEEVALAVLTKARWNVSVAVNTARKLARIASVGGTASPRVAAALTDSATSGRFVTALLTLDKKTAAALVGEVTSVRGTLGGLERGLAVLTRANAMKKPSDSLVFLAEKLGVNFSSAELASVASAHYGPAAADRRTRLLLEAHSQPPSRAGLLEFVVLRW